jgi:hypothetical protein
MKRKIHVKAVKKAIDTMFSDRNPSNLILKNENKVVWITQGIGTIDTRSETELSSLFETMFEAYQHKHPDNTKELFIEVELERAKEYQKYFPEYKTNSEHKTYYFELQRWIDFLNKVAKPTGEPQQMSSENNIKKPDFQNNFDNVSPKDIYEYFKIKLVGKGYLSEQELNDYLKAAFELKTIPKTLFKLKNTPTKQNIYTVFYSFYKDIAQKKHSSAEDYAKLLGAYFEGYNTETIRTNWAKDYKTKR